MTFDWTLPARSERYIFERLDVRMDRVGLLAGVTDCRLDWNIHRTIRGSGDLDVQTASRLVWPHTLVRPWIVVTNSSGRVATPLMTALCEVPEEDWTPAGVEVQVRLHDRTLMLDQWLIEQAYSLPAGTIITAAVRSIFAALGITSVDVTDSAKVLATPKVWLPSESEPVSWLRVLNDLLDLADYFSVHTDAMGRFQCHPYRLPSARVPSWRLADDRQSNRYKGLRIATGKPIPYNRWQFWSKGSEDVEPVEYTATNDDPDHDYSTVSTGRTITDRRVDVEGDVAALVQQAKAESMADQRTFTTEARFLPAVEHEVVDLVNEQAEVQARAALSGRSLTCKPGSLLGLTLREV